MTEDADSILIVEDNQVNAMILRAMLRKHGWDPYVASDGAQGVEMNARHRPRLILMDLQMPRLDGFAAAREIRSAGAVPAPVIVAVTANVGREVRAACEAAGFAEVLSKPVEMSQMIDLVRRCLARPR
ncbi:MAG: response regulator [Amaricoccus sp.]